MSSGACGQVEAQGVLRGLRPGGAQCPCCGGAAGDAGHFRRPELAARPPARASAQARAAFNAILKMLTNANYILQSLALCLRGREKIFFKYRELFG